jgi:coatomer protein complex subunit gamma
MSEEGESLMSSILKEVSVFKDRLKIKDEDEIYSPFEGIQKSEVLQECKKFNDSKFVTQYPRRCCIIITQLLFLVHHGEVFTEKETTTVFFGVTKLFQSKNAQLRRMMYLFIKYLAEITREEEVIIVVASLVKDMTSNDPLNRANSIRVLSRIVTGGLLGNIEKYITQAIVANMPMVASAALVSGLNWLPKNKDIVTRWGSQVSAAVSTADDMVQYHALALLYETRKNDLLAVSKIVTKYARNIPRSNLATCLLVQFTKTLLSSKSTPQQSIVSACHGFLDSCMRHQSELVIYEAARAVCELQDVVHDATLKVAVTVLHMFLTSQRSTLRFAAVRCLNKVAMKAPQEVMKCNDDMEVLIGDSNRSIATLAITTLLKTGSEQSIDRLMKQITTFMGDIGDEFKVVVVEAIQALCLKYPRKHTTLLAFLSNSLRDEGGSTYKTAIVNAIIHVMKHLPQCRDIALLHLCEFIEDCEFVDLSVSVLGLLGREVPRTQQPSRYIRFIFNRVILEKPQVRAAAVTSLAKLGLAVPSLTKSTIALLRRCLFDDENEVRDRATLYMQLLQQKQAANIEAMNASGGKIVPVVAAAEDSMQGCYERGLPQGGSVRRLIQSLQTYRQKPADGPVTMDSLPAIEEPKMASKSEANAENCSTNAMAHNSSLAVTSGSSQANQSNARVMAVPQFATYGKLQHSCDPVPLGEAEAEYVVQCTKHIFEEHVVFEFDIRNTVDEQLLENVTIECQASTGHGMWDMDPPVQVAAATAAFNKPTVAFTAFKRNTSVSVTSSEFDCVLKFTFKDVDPDDGTVDEFDEGEEDEWELEALSVNPMDFMLAEEVVQFENAWTSLSGTAQDLKAKIMRDVSDFESTLKEIITSTGMAPCNGTHIVENPNARHHMFTLSGVFAGTAKVLVRGQLVGGQNGALKVIVRSTDDAAAKNVLASFSASR